MWRCCKARCRNRRRSDQKNDLILVRYGSANRDAGHFPDPDKFDVARDNARTHLAFGAGIHTCIAAPLARKEMQDGLPDPARAPEEPALPKGMNSFRYDPNILLRGVLELHIAFDK